MNDFVRCNKLAGVYWLQGPVEKLKIKIKLKPPDDVISLPTFEDYTNESTNVSSEQNVQEYTFNWQQKSFSECEVERYRDARSCLTERELGYHELIKRKQMTAGKLFTYVHEDGYTAAPAPAPPRAATGALGALSSCLERWTVDGALAGTGDHVGGESASERHLFTSQEDMNEVEEPWTAMHVLLDDSHCTEEGTADRRAATLVSVFHDASRNCVVLQPDVTELETNPYVAETAAGTQHYGLALDADVRSAAGRPAGDLDTLVVQLHRRWRRRAGPAPAPEPGGARLHVALEIVSAAGFHAGNLYIDYHIELPEGARCEGSLRGRSHVSEPRIQDGATVYHFGHQVELCLDVLPGKEDAPLSMYLEAISCDGWRRHRSCGYTHVRLPPGAGMRARTLRCLRPDESGADERRFFLGGCRLLEELEVLSRPGLQNGDYTHTETGSILVRAGTLRESRGQPRGQPRAARHEGGAAPAAAHALLVGAEAALRQYRRARARLARASSGAATPPDDEG